MPVAYHPGSALRDYLKPSLRSLRAWDARRLLTVSKGLLQSGGSILSEGCRAVEGGSVTRWVQKASTLLQRLPWASLLALHDARLRGRQRNWKLIVHDATALPKPWAKKMEGLSTVYDGCTGELVNGYTVMLSIGVGSGSWDIHPIRATLVNPKAEDFRSQNAVFQTHVRGILAAGVGQDLLQVFDRGFDDEKWFHAMDAEDEPWMIRLKENRIVTFRGERHPLSSVAETILAERPYREGDCAIAKVDIGITLTHDAGGGKIPPETRTYALLAVRRLKYAKPLLLLLHERVKDHREAVRLYLAYLDRWEVECCIRLFKQTLCPAQVQLMTAERIQGMLHLQTLLLDFLLREHEKGRDPFGGGLWEILQERYVHDAETLTLSPYVVARALRELSLEDRLRAPMRTMSAPCAQHCNQLPLLTVPELDTVAS